MASWRRLFGRIPPPETGEEEAEPAGDVADETLTPASPETLMRLLERPGVPLSDGEDRFALSVESLGELAFASGRVAVGDPLTWPADVPVVEARRGSVEVVRRRTAEVSRNGAAILRLTGAPPVRWESLGSYGVSTGTSCFADPAALDELVARSAAYYAQEVLEGEEPLVDAMEGRTAVRYELAPDGPAIAAFTSGLGDGVYDAWLGRDAAGGAAAVLTSFDNIADETVVAD